MEKKDLKSIMEKQRDAMDEVLPNNNFLAISYPKEGWRKLSLRTRFILRMWSVLGGKRFLEITIK